MMHALIRIYIGCMFLLWRFLYRLKVEGIENIPPKGPYILSSNEIGLMGSRLTSMLVGQLFLRGKIAMPVGLADEYNWTSSWGGLYNSVGVKPILPHGRGQGASALLAQLNALQQGKVVMMNPEGEMSWDGRLIPPKPALAWLALRSAAPIVFLVTAKDTYDVWPKWAEGPHWTGKCTVRVGKPFRLTDIPCSKVSPEMVEQGNKQIVEEMTTLIYS